MLALAAALAVLAPTSAPPTSAPVVFQQLADGTYELTNGLVRSHWQAGGVLLSAAMGTSQPAATAALNQSYELRIGASWRALSDSRGVEVVQKAFAVNASWSTHQRLALPGVDQGLPPPVVTAAAPTAETLSAATVTGNGTGSATLCYNLTLSSSWAVEVALTLTAGQHHIHETIRFRRLAASHSHLDEVRVRKVYHTQGIPKELQLSFWRAVGYCGWAWPGASFVVQTLGDWSAQSGGGAFPDLTHWSGNKVHIGPELTVAHQAPPARNDQSERIEWISLDDVGVGEEYTLEHNSVMRAGYHFQREFLEYLWQLEPPQQLQPRFPARHTVDKMMFALQYTPGPAGDVGGAFREYSINASGAVNGTGAQIAIGFIAQAWYNFLGHLDGTAKIGDPNGDGHNFTLLIQHSPDWGAGMDAWSAVFMLLYKEAYGDTSDGFINRTYTKMRNGFVHLPWNYEASGSVLDGAMWEAWDQKAGMHPAAFLGSTPIFWLCDSGKSGFMFLRMFELTGGTDVDLMSRAVKAADFLLRIQLPSGDFAGSVYGEDGKPVKPPNYAATTSAVLLWSKLYELTKNETWLIAAEAAAAATEKNYLQPDAIQINGGELDDVMVNDGSRPGGLNVHGISAGTYGVMALSQLAMVTKKPEHVAMVRVAMDFMLAWQWTREINLGYYNSKARFQGADMKTTGAAVNGMVRSEVTLYSWMAYQATGDERYLHSFEQNHAWLTHQQYDNMYDERFFGGGDEGLSPSFQYVNGLGCNFFGETTGQGVGVMEYLLAKRATQ